MTVYIKTGDGDWTQIGGLCGDGVSYVRDPEPEIESPVWWAGLGEPVTMEFEMKLPKFGRVDSMMLWFGLSRKETRKMLGVKPILKKGKAWRRR